MRDIQKKIEEAHVKEIMNYNAVLENDFRLITMPEILPKNIRIALCSDIDSKRIFEIYY